MDKQRNIPLKNYILLGITLIVTIILIIYFYMLYSSYEESKLNIPIMDKYMQVINYNELDNFLVENKDGVIYCSVLENQDIRNFEKELKNVIKDYSLGSTILYLDLTNELQNNQKAKEIQTKYQINGNSLIEVPTIAVFRGGTLSSIYNIKNNNYDIEEIINYLRKEGVIND